MAPWGPLQRQLMAYVARHPEFQRAVKNAGQRVTTHPTFQKAKQRAYTAFEKAGEKTARGAGAAGQGAAGGAAGGAGESTFNKWKRKSAEQGKMHMVKAMKFIIANIMTLVVLIQFGPMIWHYCTRAVRYLSSAPARPEGEQREKRRRKKKEAEGEEPAFQVAAPDDSMRKAILQSVPHPAVGASRTPEPPSPPAPSPSQWGQSSALFDDTAAGHHSADVQQSFNSMHQDVFRSSSGDPQVSFNTSFLVKMGDETTFTSSLEREALTGGVSTRA